MKYNCPNCDRVVYNRRLPNCEFCGSELPKEMLFTQQDLANIAAYYQEESENWQLKKRQKAELEEKNKQEKIKEVTKVVGGVVVPLIIGSN